MVSMMNSLAAMDLVVTHFVVALAIVSWIAGHRVMYSLEEVVRTRSILGILTMSWMPGQVQIIFD